MMGVRRRNHPQIPLETVSELRVEDERILILVTLGRIRLLPGNVHFGRGSWLVCCTKIRCFELARVHLASPWRRS